MWRPEEKGSDVNLASRLLNDAWSDAFDVAAVLTTDSDLTAPIRLSVARNKTVLIILETAVGCARVCRERRDGQGETKQRTLVRNEEQHSQDRRARCNRVHSAVT